MELKGFSGCKLIIKEKDSHKRVMKISPNEQYNSRLKAQKKKQESLQLKGFETCRIYSEGYVNGLYYFYMDYINGITLAKSMEDINLISIYPIMKAFSYNMVQYERKNLKANERFREKIKMLRFGIKEADATIELAFDYLDDFSWEYVVDSSCHGDLTLENIMIQNNEMVLIDCLDSFYDSWMVDAAKMLQDLEIFWSYRNESISNNLIVRLTIMRDLLMEEILQLREGENMVDTIYHILLLNLLRILPYTYDDKTKNFLINKIDGTIKTIKYKGWR